LGSNVTFLCSLLHCCWLLFFPHYLRMLVTPLFVHGAERGKSVEIFSFTPLMGWAWFFFSTAFSFFSLRSHRLISYSPHPWRHCKLGEIFNLLAKVSPILPFSFVQPPPLAYPDPDSVTTRMFLGVFSEPNSPLSFTVFPCVNFRRNANSSHLSRPAITPLQLPFQPPPTLGRAIFVDPIPTTRSFHSGWCVLCT